MKENDRETIARVISVSAKASMRVEQLFSDEFRPGHGLDTETLVPVYELYGKAFFPIRFGYEAPNVIPAIVHIAKQIVDWESRDAHLDAFYCAPSHLDDEIKAKLRAYALWCELACLLNWGIGYKALAVELGKGIEGSFEKILQVDKTFALSPLGQRKILTAQYAGDWETLAAFGKAMAKPQLEAPPYMVEVLLTVTYLWDEIFRQKPYRWTVKALEQAGLLPTGVEDPRSLSKRLNRLGLKKSKHNRK